MFPGPLVMARVAEPIKTLLVLLQKCASVICKRTSILPSFLAWVKIRQFTENRINNEYCSVNGRRRENAKDR